jgi:sec-independent protein translocase protein TatA
MGALEPGHLIIVLIIILVIFGPGKLPQLGKSLGEGIREFRRNTESHDTPEPTQAAAATTTNTTTTTTSTSTSAPTCRNCGAVLRGDQKFCGACGSAQAAAAPREG